ncbi:hypothetical protein LguiB_023155 [Lonicera macranthoides]
MRSFGRLALKNIIIMKQQLKQRLVASSSDSPFTPPTTTCRSKPLRLRPALSSYAEKERLMGFQLPKRLSSTAVTKAAAAAGDDDYDKSSGGGPLLKVSEQEFFPSGLGDALVQATENIKRVLEKLEDSERIWVKESDEYYKVRYEVPGLAKENVKVTVEDGILVIKEEDDDGDKQNTSSSSSSSSSGYGYYNTELGLPDDAKMDEINAEMKDGVMYITIPRAQKQNNKDVKEVHVH